jgi:hypothetical protein
VLTGFRQGPASGNLRGRASEQLLLEQRQLIAHPRRLFELQAARMFEWGSCFSFKEGVALKHSLHLLLKY